jgi:ribosomal protein L27
LSSYGSSLTLSVINAIASSLNVESSAFSCDGALDSPTGVQPTAAQQSTSAAMLKLLITNTPTQNATDIATSLNVLLRTVNSSSNLLYQTLPATLRAWISNTVSDLKEKCSDGTEVSVGSCTTTSNPAATSSGLSAGTTAGIVIGVLVAVTIVIILGCYVIRRRGTKFTFGEGVKFRRDNAAMAHMQLEVSHVETSQVAHSAVATAHEEIELMDHTTSDYDDPPTVHRREEDGEGESDTAHFV